ncbi:MAG: HEPN domain-containing protein, partial [Phaeodactylibacter sp.]|nr:HEPN domain-containing protein [Phaeodactylibacter sp.]
GEDETTGGAERHVQKQKIFILQSTKDNLGDFPPRIHNVRRLAEQTNLNLDSNQLVFLEQINTFQLEGRYPDYRFSIYQTFDKQKTKLILDETENFHQWLLNKLP